MPNDDDRWGVPTIPLESWHPAATVTGRAGSRWSGWTRSHSRVSWVALGVALALATDLISSAWAVDRLGTQPPTGARGGLVQFRLVANTGASFGFGAGHGLVVALLESVALAMLIVLALHTPTRVMAFVVGGAGGGGLGNLIDRAVGPHGNHPWAVIDWIHVDPYPAVFNVADIWIRVGLVAAGLALVVRKRRFPKAEDDRASAVPEGEVRPATGPGPTGPELMEVTHRVGSGPAHRAAESASPTERRS